MSDVLALPEWLWAQSCRFHAPAFIYPVPETLRYDPGRRRLTGHVRLLAGPYLREGVDSAVFNTSESEMAALQMMGLLIGCHLFPPREDGTWTPPVHGADDAGRFEGFPQNAVVRRHDSRFLPLAGPKGSVAPADIGIEALRVLPSRDGRAIFAYRLTAAIGPHGEHQHEARLRFLTDDIHGVDEAFGSVARSS